MFEHWRKLFPGNPEPEPEPLDAEVIAGRLDLALNNYSELLDSRDAPILEIARDRILDLHQQYQAAKLRELERIS